MRIERPLGTLEKYQVSKQLTRCYGSVTSTAVLRHSSRRGQDAKQFYLNQLYAPLALLVKKHPQLSLVVTESNKSTVHFLRLESFNLESIIGINEFAFWDQAELAQVIGNECDREFDLNDHTIPLWHLTIGIHQDRPEECSITIAAHHVIFDGKSLAQFWQDLELGLQSEPSDDYVIESGEAPLMGPYEDRGAPMPTTMDLLPIVGKMLAKKILPTSFFQYWFPEGWAGDVPGNKNQTHDTAVRIVQVDGPVWSKVCTTCRDRGVTPHAAIMAALVEAFANLYPNTMVKTTTPTNCRPVSPQVARDEMGNFFGAYTHTWTKSDVKFWDRAKIYGQLLKANKTQAAKVAGQLSYFSKYPEDYCDFWYGHLENPMGRSGGIELSDLGRVVLNKSWQIQSLWFCQSAQVFTSPLSINTISTQDTMYASIGWQRGSLDESKADALGPLLLETLKNYIHDY